MSGDPPETNGTDPLENGVNGTEDAEMEDKHMNEANPSKSGKDQDGDEEMTVVVPPSKNSKATNKPQRDGDGDVAMDVDDKTSAEESSVDVVDPRTKTIAGTPIFISSPNDARKLIVNDSQISRTILTCWSAP